MVKKRLIVRNLHGLHARVAAQVVNECRQFSSSVKVNKGNLNANGSSILQLISLGACEGCEVEVVVSGIDENAALAAVSDIFENGAGI
jgi:phosphotransferase system HPr (HPr) family protein